MGGRPARWPRLPGARRFTTIAKSTQLTRMSDPTPGMTEASNTSDATPGMTEASNDSARAGPWNRDTWVVGLMSGTSLDGIDAALLRSDGRDWVETGPFITRPYDEIFRGRLRAPVAELRAELELRHLLSVLPDKHCGRARRDRASELRVQPLDEDCRSRVGIRIGHERSGRIQRGERPN